MNPFADQLMHLITLWKEFVDREEQTELRMFARWLLGRERKDDLIDQIDRDIHSFFSPTETDDLMNAQISMLWGQIDNYRAQLFRHLLKSLDLNGIDEYSLLLFVDLHVLPSKKEYVKSSNLEPTTCFEMIKRLQRKGFILERENPEDKRSRTMQITESGKKILEIAKTKLKNVNHSMYNHLSLQEKKEIIEQLNMMVSTVASTLEQTIHKDNTNP